MPRDKLARINDLIEEITEEANQPIWSESERTKMVDALCDLDEIKKSVQRTDYDISLA